MKRSVAEFCRRIAPLLLLVSACGGESEHHSTTGGTGGSTGGGATGGSSGTGGGTPLPDCTPPIAEGTKCSDPAAHCGGPCVNSWQADYTCKDGTWTTERVAACGPNADHAPQCRNAFSSGALTPCCPEGELDCRGQPDGYPGFSCTPEDGSFCSCGCYGGQQSCGC